MNIPMVDLKGQYNTLKQEIDKAVLETLSNAQYILGPNVKKFEEESAAYLGTKHAIGVASGTDALHLALIAAGIKKGDEVITTPFTFIATAEAIKYVGAKPVFVDIDRKTFNIDLNLVENAITEKTKAVIPVHLFGQPVNMNELNLICMSKGIIAIEDCAQSFGADINEQMTGSFGTVGAFSFFPSKNLGCYGDGGLITTSNDSIASEIRTLRNHGSRERYHHNILGYNSRLDELQATILNVKLKYINEFNQKRRYIAHHYTSELSGTGIQVPYEDECGLHVYHQYTLLHQDRDIIMDALKSANITSAIYYPIPLHKQEVFTKACKDVCLPTAESIAKQCFSLPIFPEMTEKQIDAVTTTIKGVM